MKKILFVASATLTLIGCGASEPVKIGTETYTLSSRTSGGASGARTDALQKASEFCTKRGGLLSVLKEHSEECAIHVGCGNADVTFSCVDAGEPKKRSK